MLKCVFYLSFLLTSEFMVDFINEVHGAFGLVSAQYQAKKRVIQRLF
jgi:hypothetical protein